MDISVRRYTHDLRSDWDAILAGSRNGNFLFARDFIEYHGERFHDMSAIAYLGGKPVAFMPATFDVKAGEVCSHPGLTFGGAVLLRELRGDVAIAVINAILDGFREWGAINCTVKIFPQILATYPSEEMAYALWRRGFKLVRRDLSSLLPLDTPLPFNSSKAHGVKRAVRSSVSVIEAEVDEFHVLLSEVLHEQHGVAPIHSRDELVLLKKRFPRNIFVRAACKEGELLAGTLLFNYGHVWHTQYLASSAAGRELGALDLVIHELKAEAAAACVNYLSFGTSMTAPGEINEGLLWQKESYGARPIVFEVMRGQLATLD